MSSSKHKSIDDHIAELEMHKEPDRDLFTGISLAIEHAENVPPSMKNKQFAVANKQTYVKPMFAVAASIFIAMVVGYSSFHIGRVDSGQSLVAQMSQQHNVQKESLLTSLRGQAATTQNWQQQVNELDEAADAIKKALQNEPNNPALLKMLQRVYEQQIALIERVHAPAWQHI